MPLGPVDHISATALPAARRSLIVDSACASVTGAFSGGVILASFAIAMGANPQQIGLLAAIPFIAQLAQLPATALVEHVRQRRKIGVLAVTIARLVITTTALIPFIPDTSVGLQVLIGMQIVLAVFNAMGGCAINSWLHHFVPRNTLGDFFSRRLFWGTAAACVATLLAGIMIDELPVANKLHTYALSFALAGVAGFIGIFFLARVPEPRMPPRVADASVLRQLWEPFADRNFRKLLIFLGSWNVASNVAAPFLTVFLIRQLEYPLTMVTALWVCSQVANAFTLYAWGRVSDRLSNKAILAAALPVHFVCMFLLVFCDAVPYPALQLWMLFAIHVLMGIAGGGISLAAGNLGLKLAPQGHGTPYLAAIGLVTAFTAGVTPIIAGSLAHVFEASELSAVLRWVHSANAHEFTVLRFAHWEFLFALSAMLGLYVMHALSRVRDGDEVSERVVIQEFALEALRTADLSSLGGTLGAIFPFFDKLYDRIAFWQAPPSPPGTLPP